MRTPKDTIIAYTAGMIDGEGSLQINPAKRSKTSTTYYLNSTVQVTSCDSKVLFYLCKEWGIGKVTSWKPKSARRKLTYNWRVYSKESSFLLKRVIPFLIIKKERAEILLEFRRYIGHGRAGLSTRNSEKRIELAQRLRDLNARCGKGSNSLIRGGAR